VPEAVQSLSALQAQLLVPAVQTPDWQVSPVVQARPSSQPVPSPSTGLVQTPVEESQRPMPWQPSCAVQLTVDEGSPHWPETQCSPVVQRLLSSQPASSGRFAKLQVPLETSQLALDWHWVMKARQSGSAEQRHAEESPATQVPAEQ
jgi:hypothetical protein